MNIRTIIKRLIPRNLFRTIEPWGHWVEAVVYNCIYGFPAKNMKVIGITGTNGKTTTSFLVHRMLTDAGYKTGMMTTVAYGVGNDIQPQVHHMTTVPVPELMRRLKWMKGRGVEWLVLETTSHALAQHRVWGVPYSVAVMTNITHEHLAYHGTFERYVAAKQMMFQMAQRNKTGFQMGIANADDLNGASFVSETENSMLYGIEAGDTTATNIKLKADGIEYDALTPNGALHIESALPGSFNVYNTLAAICVGQAVGLDNKQISQGIKAMQGVEGRMNRIDEGQDFTVIVDYAHTPDSFDKLFSDLRPVVKGNIYAVFGSLGGGDKGKRPQQGQIAGKFADVVIVCQEDDRMEDPNVIANDIAEGAEQSGKTRGQDLLLIHDRTKAIQYAMDHAVNGDMVLLLGKGHEKTMEDASGEHPWDEPGTARKALRKRLQKA